MDSSAPKGHCSDVGPNCYIQVSFVVYATMREEKSESVMWTNDVVV
jgi:hypothetical protein